MAYFSFFDVLIGMKKEWLRLNMPGGHNKFYQYNYYTTSRVWGGGYASKTVTGVYIYDKKIAEKYKDCWIRKYKHHVKFDRLIIVNSEYYIQDLFKWCEKNMKGKWTIMPVIKKDERLMAKEWLFTAQQAEDAIAFKLRWL